MDIICYPPLFVKGFFFFHEQVQRLFTNGSKCRKKLPEGSFFCLLISLWEVSEGLSPPTSNPNPATCAVGSEALRSKVSLRVSPSAPKVQEKPVSAEKIAQRAFSTV